MLSIFSLVLLTGFAFQAGAPAGNSLTPANSVSSAPGLAADLTPEMRGDIMMARKMYRDALDYYKPGAEKNAVLANKTGIAYHQLLDFNNAKKYYEKAVKLNPRYAEAINNLGTIYYARKSYRRAVEQYKKALRMTPESASILSNLGTAYFARKDYENASKAYQQAVALDPEVFERRSTQGTLLQDQSVEERAKFHYYLAKTYAQAGTKDRALLYIRKALEEGFKDREKFIKDKEFAALQDDPEFIELLATEQRVL
ncbi:MAG: tetratricopeptide repeat protein [Bryobacterales bacterium]|nr:tetratricopeptide repeat protein [Bryobacterales bacterium]MBV9399026.1 tetratricopeptide repeat protein [Bryobacterales bacterium]